jgi:NADH dehydrogenase
LGGPQQFTLREIVQSIARITGSRRWIVGLPDFVARIQALAMDFVPGRPFSSDNYRSLTVDSVCTQDGFAALGIKPQSMDPMIRQFLGVFEDNARLSQCRADHTKAGRA